MLKLTSVNSRYGKNRILWDVSMEVQKGQIVCLIGANGAGKSTLLKVICGYVPVTSGEIFFMDEKINGIKTQNLVARGISRIPEGRKIFPYMTVLENIELGAFQRKDRAGIKEDIKYVYEIFPILVERENQVAGTLSGGEQQMLAIGRGLMARPKLFLLDEPSLGLAPMLVKEIACVITDINKNGTSILLVEQNSNMALKISDFGYVIETGQIKLHGASSQLLNNEYVKKAYLGG